MCVALRDEQLNTALESIYAPVFKPNNGGGAGLLNQ